ncbi:MAG: peptide-methionine (S)-S-oxide reductase MsrA [Rhodocyclaceae bacterium]|nr:peptide-methionine (S)-S-oxide reductase MsrA [Rhodocyclaceae bacterium]
MNKTFVLNLVAAALAAWSAGAGAADAPAGKTATAIFAGGCFWCVEADFEKLPGVLGAESGYAGGNTPEPTYQKVSAGGTGYAEAVRVTYDPAKVSYEKLLDYFWRHVDPTVKDRQFCDAGSQYRTAIFYQDQAQQAAAEKSRDAILESRRFKVIYTEIAPAGTFYVAEEYHQDYYKKNPLRYNYYRHGCGRDARVREVWGSAAH